MDLVGGNTDCLLPATVPDSAADEGVPLLLARRGAVVVLSAGSIIAVGLLAQGAAVPMVGLGLGSLDDQGAVVVV